MNKNLFKTFANIIKICFEQQEQRSFQEIDASRNFLSSILENINEGILVIDRNFKIILANKAYSEQVKKGFEEIKGNYCYKVSHLLDRPCYEEGEECPTKYTFDTGNQYIVTHTHFDKDGNLRYVEIKSYPLKDTSGNVTSVIEIINDVTEYKKKEEEVNRRIKELEEFYDMAIGRELSMIELKEEIDKLKEEIKRLKKE